MVSLVSELAGMIAAVSVIMGTGLIFFGWKKLKKAHILLYDAELQQKNAKIYVENERRESMLKLKDEIHKRRNEFELEIKRERLELERFQNKINTKSESLDKKEHRIDEQATELQQRERNLTRLSDKLRINEGKIKTLYEELITKLEHASNVTRDDARKQLLDTLEAEVRLSSEKWMQKVEEEVRQTAKERSNNIIISAMQRYISDQVAPHSSGLVSLPNDDMKGRIIGKEGRNIKALETATGMEFDIGLPEVIMISGFNPIRREVARRALEKLINDGRINPSRIEETVAQCENEIEELIEEFGKEAILDFNLQGVHPEIITLLGKLYFRTSFSQNVLSHCKEVGLFARMIAQELGLDGQIALRAGLLHDIGKAVSAEIEGPHAQIGGEIAKRCGEDPIIVNAIAAHHEEIPFTSIYSAIVVIADTISASRPGARRETLSAYIKRCEKLEDIAQSFEGIRKAYALQAGREVRVIVEEDYIDDDKAATLARDIARMVENEMSFPGQIKINVIREKRSVEYAR